MEIEMTLFMKINLSIFINVNYTLKRNSFKFT